MSGGCNGGLSYMAGRAQIPARSTTAQNGAIYLITKDIAGLFVRQSTVFGGWGGIRTHGELAPTPVFKTGALNRSATHPNRGIKHLPDRAGAGKGRYRPIAAVTFGAGSALVLTATPSLKARPEGPPLRLEVYRLGGWNIGPLNAFNDARTRVSSEVTRWATMVA